MFKTNSLTPKVKNIIVDSTIKTNNTLTSSEFLGEGTYLCRNCGIALFECFDKFEPDTGWANFESEFGKTVKINNDPNNLGAEAFCNRCNAYLGYVFFGEEYTKLNTKYCINFVTLDFVHYNNIIDTEEIILAAGCFWGVEQLISNVKGVLKTEVGYIGGITENPTYEQICAGLTKHIEAVRVIYDPELLSCDDLIKFFFEIHDFEQQNGQGNDIGSQYLSRVFYHTIEQREIACKLISILQAKGLKVACEVELMSVFWKAEKYHQKYYDQNGGHPYCHSWKKISW